MDARVDWLVVWLIWNQYRFITEGFNQLLCYTCQNNTNITPCTLKFFSWDSLFCFLLWIMIRKQKSSLEVFLVLSVSFKLVQICQLIGTSLEILELNASLVQLLDQSPSSLTLLESWKQDFSGRVKGIKVDAVDTTGAGDAFVAGILSQLASDVSLLQVSILVCYPAI